MRKPSPWLVLGHLFIVYISWGSTYIGLKLSQEALGPFTVCGLRMALGGLLMSLFLMLVGKWRLPSLADLRHATFFGLTMVLMASGFLSKGQEYIDSTVAAVVAASTPITMLLAGWLFAGEERPSWPQCFGLAAGFCGLLLLAASNASDVGNSAGAGVQADSVGMIWVLVGTFGWVGGSLLMRRRPLKSRISAHESCALLLTLGGLECLLLALLCGEEAMIHLDQLRPAVYLAFAWMVIGGAILAYSSYFWLLAHTTLATAVSYEYVVPVIGLFLGWWIGGEAVTQRMILASCLTVGSVCLVMWHKHNR